MFQLNEEEYKILISQIAMSKKGSGGRRQLPYAFTEHGILMLSSILRSEKAIEVNIQIMRMFTRMRDVLLTNAHLLLEIQEIKKHLSEHDDSIESLMNYLKQFNKSNGPRNPIGFKK